MTCFTYGPARWRRDALRSARARIIAVRQDRAGNQATLAFDTDEVQIFVKTLVNRDQLVARSPGVGDAQISVDWGTAALTR